LIKKYSSCTNILIKTSLDLKIEVIENDRLFSEKIKKLALEIGERTIHLKLKRRTKFKRGCVTYSRFL